MALLGRKPYGSLCETTRLWLHQTTRQLVGRWPVGLRRNYGITESRIYGSTDLWILVSLRRTTDYGYALLRQTTSLRDNEWGGSRWGFAGITESRIDGIMELRIGRVGWGLKVQSLSIPLYTLYTFYTLLYSQLTANCSHALALRCLLSVDCCP